MRVDLCHAWDWHAYKRDPQDFPGDPVAQTPSSQCRGPGFNPCLGN